MSNLTNAGRLPLSKKSNSLAVFERPQFNYEQNKWATTRELNVEEISRHWEKDINLVRVLSDRKLGANSLVMLRKDQFEKIVKVLEDLLNGEAVIRANLSAVFSSIKVIEKLVEEQGPEDTALYRAVHSLMEICGTVNSVVEFSNPPRKVRPSKLTAQEAEELRQIEAEDKK